MQVGLFKSGDTRSTLAFGSMVWMGISENHIAFTSLTESLSTCEHASSLILMSVAIRHIEFQA